MIISLTYLILACMLGYSAICAYLYLNQRHILYLPNQTLLSPKEYGLIDFQEVTLTTSDYVTLTSWYKPAKKGKKTFVYFHGNAGNLSNRIEKLKTFTKNGTGIIALSYRGYGSSHGHPSETGFYQDARTAIEYLLNQKIPAKQLTFYGESLGSGVAIQMALEYPCHSIILEAPYQSILKLAQERYPFLPIAYLLKDQYHSIDKIGDIQVPVLVFHGLLDAVTPIHHGKLLFEQANEPKEAHFISNTGHTDFNLPILQQQIEEFLEKHRESADK